MKNNETGEFELVMGNRQLLSGFFIVCLLFGVAFAMGYIVGRNSSPSARAVADMGVPAQAPVVSDTRPAAAGAVTPPAAPPAGAPKTGEVPPPEGGTQPGTAQPAGGTPPAAGLGQTTPVAQPAAGQPAAPAAAQEPGSGMYWQVMAIKQPDADIVSRTLKDKGFPAFTEPATNNLFRVLVGPYADRTTLGKAKADLENAGFHTFLHKK